MKLLHQKVLAKLKEIRQDGSGAFNKERVSLVFKEIQDELAGNIATNFDDLISQILRSFGYDIDRMIQYLERLVANRFDAETEMEDVEEGFDGCFGTDTGSIREQLELPEVVSTERMQFSARYHPTPTRVFKSMLKLLPKYGIGHKDYVFIDIGAGAGRNLMLASEYPFKKITGVEISSYLCQKAKENIERYNAVSQKPCDARIICTDVLDFTLPEEDTILYFWEPFTNEIMSRFLPRIEERIRDHSVKYVLIFFGRTYLDENHCNTFRLLGTEYESNRKAENGIFRISYYTSSLLQQ